MEKKWRADSLAKRYACFDVAALYPISLSSTEKALLDA